MTGREATAPPGKLMLMLPGVAGADTEPPALVDNVDVCIGGGRGAAAGRGGRGIGVGVVGAAASLLPADCGCGGIGGPDGLTGALEGTLGSFGCFSSPFSAAELVAGAPPGAGGRGTPAGLGTGGRGTEAATGCGGRGTAASPGCGGRGNPGRGAPGGRGGPVAALLSLVDAGAGAGGATGRDITVGRG